MQGLIHFVGGQIADSLDDYRAALAAFDRLGAVQDQAAAHLYIAENLEAIGDLSRSWTHEREALARLDVL
jgi:hypothetical protein